MNKFLTAVFLVVFGLSLMNPNELPLDELKTKQAVNTGFAIGGTGTGIMALSNITGIVSVSLFITAFGRAFAEGLGTGLGTGFAIAIGNSISGNSNNNTNTVTIQDSTLVAIYLSAIILGWTSVGLFIIGLAMTIAGFSYAAYYKKHKHSFKPILSGNEVGISISL